MSIHHRNPSSPKSPAFLPAYLERYAAEVDEWHQEALTRRAARARALHPAKGSG